MSNLIQKRPAFAAIHKLGIAAIVGAWLGEAANTHKENYMAERDFQMFHYMCLHPEDFPKPKRVLYRDYLTEWYPMR